MKLLDHVREVMRTKRYSYRTEQCYVAWIEHFIRFHHGPDGWRHPADLDAADVEPRVAEPPIQSLPRGSARPLPPLGKGRKRPLPGRADPCGLRTRPERLS
jgi:hypothetical protein